jgi:erythromycin esterase
MRQILLLITFSSSLLGQTDLRTFILNNSTEVKSISIYDTSFSDLEHLGQAVKDFSVIMLGEMWHGDGATFEAKSRIIRFLHEKHNFNVLAFESDFYSLTKGFEKLKGRGVAFDSLIQNNVFSYWSQSAQCKPLFDYIRLDSSFRLCGIDNQLKGEFCKTDLKSDLSAYINNSNLNFLKTEYYKKQFWNDFDTSLSVFTEFSWKNKVRYRKEALKRLILAIDTITYQLSAKNSVTDFPYQTLLNYRSLCDMFVNLNDFNKASNIRDEQMSKNLEWLVRIKYPSEKVIVWLASSHMVKDNQASYLKPSQQISMGHYYSRNKANPKAYVLGFTSDTGKGYAIGNMTYKIPKTKAHSIEKIFKTFGKEFLFVSLIDYKLKFDNEYLFSKIDGGNNIKATWSRSVDGVFYIDKMTPATKR